MKTIPISDENEKYNVYKILKRWYISDNFYGSKNQKFVRKADLMKTDRKNLVIIDDSINKTYIGNWEMTRAKKITYNIHI